MATVAGSANVADAPLTAAGRSISPVEGAAFTGVVATFTDADPGGVVSDYTATIDWGDGHTSAGAITLSAGVFSVSGTNAYAEEGCYVLSVTIRDVGGAQASVSATATVADAPLSATAQPIQATEGAAFTGVVATFTDAGSDGTTADYSATIAWGDGQTS